MSNASPSNLPLIIVAVVAFFVFVSLRRRREAIRHAIRRVFFAEVTYLLVVYFMVQADRTTMEALLAGVLCGVIVNQMMPGRSRHIPASVRRRKIAEFELRTGQKFNSRKHELDHEVPFSRGGGSTEDNIVVTEKKKNRSKGAKTPWWDLLGR